MQRACLLELLRPLPLLTRLSRSLILDGIDQVEWPDSEAAPQQPSTSTAHPADDELLPLDAVTAGPTTSTAMRAAATRPPVRPGPQGKPQLQRGPSLGGAKLGEIPLRVGQPYLFVHQGNNEHIWTVDEIRSVVALSRAHSYPR